MESLTAREGDVLVVQYGEVKIPVIQYSTVSVGGLTYSRQLKAGENVSVEYDKVYAFLKSAAERDGREKIRAYSEELRPSPKPQPKPEPPALPPKNVQPPRTAGAR